MEAKIYYKGKKQNGIKRDIHRIIMEEHIGRKLSRYEVVHHINGNIHDNRLENLRMMSLSEHSKMHRIGSTKSDEAKKKLSITNTGRQLPTLWKMDERQTKEALERIDKGESMRSIARSFGVSHGTISRSIKRTTCPHKERWR